MHLSTALNVFREKIETLKKYVNEHETIDDLSELTRNTSPGICRMKSTSCSIWDGA